jgi:hypothetical protein
MRAFAVVVLLVALAACGPSDDAATAQAYTGTVSVTRTGGIAGVQDTVVLDAGDGTWRRTAGRGPATSGTLSADRLNEVQPWLVVPVLADEAARPAGDQQCADAFEYTLTMEGSVVRWTDCTPTPPTNAGNVARLLIDATD